MIAVINFIFENMFKNIFPLPNFNISLLYLSVCGATNPFAMNCHLQQKNFNK
jgi:hypothetical protein